MGMKLLSHLMKLLHLMTLPSQQFCLCGTLFNVFFLKGSTLFNVHDTLMKHTLRLALQHDPPLLFLVLFIFTKKKTGILTIILLQLTRLHFLASIIR